LKIPGALFAMNNLLKRLNISKLWLLVALAIFLPGVSSFSSSFFWKASNAETCKALIFTAHEGRKADRIIEPMEEFPLSGYSYYLLGSGTNGVIYRIVPKDGSSAFIVKRYTNLYQRQHDVELLSSFRGLQDKGLDLGFYIPEARVLGRDAVVTEDTRGQDLEKLAGGTELKIDQKKTLEKLYAENLAKFRKVVESHFEFSMKYPLADVAYPSFGDERINLPTWNVVYKNLGSIGTTYGLVKADNIIVDPVTLRMSLIDPF
jgi:hypothetical protein